ncbi:MAG: hypothetical protein ACOH2L_06510 [Devosia sp.]
MIIIDRLPNAPLSRLPHAVSLVLTWLHRRDQARRRRQETINLSHMPDHLRRDMGLQDYQTTHRRP